MTKWIKSRGANGEYGYRNLDTGEFRTTLPNSKEEKLEALTKLNRAVLDQYSLKRVKYEEESSKRKNHSDETIKKKIWKPQISVDKSGNMKTTDLLILAQSEDSASGVDPAAKFIVENIGFAKAIPAIRYGVLRGAAALGNKLAATTLVGDALAEQVGRTQLVSKEPLLNIGWQPKQTLSVSHASDTGEIRLFYPNRWDVVNEGANPHGIWLLGKLGTPRTELTNPGKGMKAEKARQLFANRPYQMEGLITLNKPIGTVGDVSDRSALSYQADLMGADGLIYNGVYDNGYNNNLVILSFNKPSFILGFNGQTDENFASLLIKDLEIGRSTYRTHIIDSDENMVGGSLFSLKMDNFPISSLIQGHGIAKFNLLGRLGYLLKNGVDLKNIETFYTAPLSLTDKEAASALGTSSGTPYYHGIGFVIPNKYGKLEQVWLNDAGGELVNEGIPFAFPSKFKSTLQQMFPNTQIYTYSDNPANLLKLSQFPKGYQSIFEQRLKNGAIENLSKENGIVNTESVPVHFSDRTTQGLINYYSTSMGYPIDKKLLDTIVRGGGYTITDQTGKKHIVLFPKFIEEKYGNPMVTGLVYSHEFDHGVYTPIKIEGFNEKMNPEEASALFTELKNFNGITDPKTSLTKAHWDNFKNNYLKETGLNPNRYGFIDNVIDLGKALKWGTVSSLGLSPIVFNHDK